MTVVKTVPYGKVSLITRPEYAKLINRIEQIRSEGRRVSISLEIDKDQLGLRYGKLEKLT